jgi:hypothetical protein
MLHGAVHRLYQGVLYSQNVIILDKVKRQIPSQTHLFSGVLLEICHLICVESVTQRNVFHQVMSSCTLA